MKLLPVYILLIAQTALLAQMPEGTITYNRKTDWISIMSKLPYISQEEVDRVTLTWGNGENKGRNFNLFFKDNKSLYTFKEEESENTYSWRKDELLYIRDYNKNTIKDIREEVGTKFLVEDELPKTKWKILNEIKEIEGYLCMKAETTNTTKGQIIHAWFTDAIPMSGGPEGMGGLPGMILELDINDGDAVITATSVDLETPLEKLPIPKKMKGKKTDVASLTARQAKFIEQSIEGQKNPYWRIRY